MIKFKTILFSLLALAASFSVYAQDETSYEFTKKGLIKTVETSEGTEQYNILKPIMVLKSDYQLGVQEGYSRFSIQSARLGVQGETSKLFSYRFLFDFCAENKLTVLDLYVAIKPTERLSFTIGQQGLSLYNPWTVSPNSVDFINRPFVGKYFTSSRDIGISLKYALKKEGFPINAEFGVYNGSGINNPTWNKSVATGGRLEFGSTKEGFRASAKFYNQRNNGYTDLFAGADLRYENSKFKIETEYMSKKYGEELDGRYSPDNLGAVYVESMFKIQVNNNLIKRIDPLVRWDAMGYDVMDRGFGVNRATAGVNFVLNTGAVTSMFKINYEQYFNSKMDLSALFKTVRYNENKLSLEYLMFF